MMPRTDLPVRDVLPDLVKAVRAEGAAVLVAPPGSGKTTLMPLALADELPGRIVVAQPRRVAARAAAARMAELTGSALGELVGYTIRGESRASGRNRVEVVTTGVLVQRLQRDPELPGVGAVVLDECHERHLDTDLALAFGIEVRQALRPDLVLVATSATAQAERLAEVIGPRTPVVVSHGRGYPVEVLWAPPVGPIDAPYGLRVDPRLLDHVAALIRRSLTTDQGDILVFLPGAGELAKVQERLSGVEAQVLTLHGRQTGRTQDDVLKPSPRRRVVLATAVAETSLTVPGVRVVIDAGLSRVPRIDLARGLGQLITVRSSQASATQRAGRAGREAPGKVYRCWSEADHARLPEYSEPEIASADLTAFTLQLARWGSDAVPLLDAPPAAATQVARATLTALGATDADGRITDLGRAISDVGAHPRLARALLSAAPLVGAERAAGTVALLAGDATPPTDDLPAAVRRLRDGHDRAATAAWRSERQRLLSSLPSPSNQDSSLRLTDDAAAALVVALAYPERVARQRKAGSLSYLMTGGSAAELGESSALRGLPWLAVADADRQPGRTTARIRLAAPLDEATARRAAESLLVEADEVSWVDGDVLARHVIRLGAIVLTERPLTTPDPALVAQAVAEGIRQEGLGLLRWTGEAVALRARLAFLHHALGSPWPAVDDATLLNGLSDWLPGELGTARKRADLARLNVAAALRHLIPWNLAGQLDELAPERVEVPSGSRITVDYADPAAPTLSVKLQETFGWPATPRLAGGRVPLLLHLLSPAGRPAAVTSDLGSFWRNGYPQVRAELRGRYPKHPWPDDPTTATPTRRVSHPRSTKQ